MLTLNYFWQIFILKFVLRKIKAFLTNHGVDLLVHVYGSCMFVIWFLNTSLHLLNIMRPGIFLFSVLGFDLHKTYMLLLTEDAKEEEIDQELVLEAESAWSQREWSIQHVLFPSMRLFLKPPTLMATNGTFVKVLELRINLLFLCWRLHPNSFKITLHPFTITFHIVTPSLVLSIKLSTSRLLHWRNSTKSSKDANVCHGHIGYVLSTLCFVFVVLHIFPICVTFPMCE